MIVPVGSVSTTVSTVLMLQYKKEKDATKVDEVNDNE
jgi:hypothetical protein